MQSLILASGSPYRQQRLKDAGIHFYAHPANIDESRLPNESAEELSVRLAYEKALSIKSQYPEDIVIGSDQVAEVYKGTNPIILGKAGTISQATEQLTLCSNKTVAFYTSLCLIGNGTQPKQLSVELVLVTFKALTKSDIQRYLMLDEPFDCAGSFKMEKAGILLFDKIISEDPNALIGMPMILLCKSLTAMGLSIFDFVKAN